MYNKQQLYNHIIRNISKTVKRYINESFNFSDINNKKKKVNKAFNFGDVKQDKREMLHKTYHTAILDGLKEEFKKYLIDMESTVREKDRVEMLSTEEPIYYNDQTKEFYIFPEFFYNPQEQRRRKRSKNNEVPKYCYYRYIIKANDDNTLTLGIKQRYQSLKWLYLQEPVLRFIENSTLPIKSIYLYYIDSYQPEFPIRRIEEVQDTIAFFPGKMPRIKNSEFNKRSVPEDIKLNDIFVKNFPKILEFKNNQRVDFDQMNATSLYRGMFSSAEKYFEIVKILVEHDFIIQDENGNKYYKDNIQEYLDDVNKAGDIDMKEDEKIQWLYDHIGKDYIDKFLLVKEQIQNNDYYARKHFYFKKFNGCFRTPNAKFTLDTIKEVCKANGIDFDTLNKNDEDISNRMDQGMFDHRLATQCLYKIAYKIYEDMPNGWRQNEPDAYDFVHGKEFDNGYMVSHSSMGFNDLNFALDNLVNIYYFFYVFAYAVNNFLVTPFDFDERGYIPVAKQHKKDVNMETFNFDPIIIVFKTIVDKLMKKFKLK